MRSTEASPVSSEPTHLDENLPDPPPGMRYVLVPEQQPSSTSPQLSLQAQQQPPSLPQCYACGTAASERCFFGTNGVNQCKKIMCLQHGKLQCKEQRGAHITIVKNIMTHI